MLISLKSQKGIRKANIKHIGNYEKRKNYYVKKVKVRGFKNKRGIDPASLRRKYVYDNIKREYVKAKKDEFITVKTTEGKRLVNPISLKTLYKYEHGVYNQTKETDRISVREKDLSPSFRYQVRVKVQFVYNNRRVQVDGFSPAGMEIGKEGKIRKAFDHAVYNAMKLFNIDIDSESFRVQSDIKILKTEYVQIIQ